MNRIQLHWRIQELIDGDDPFQGNLLWINFTCKEPATDSFEVHIMADAKPGWKQVQADYKDQLESVRGMTVVKQQVRFNMQGRYRVLIYCCSYK